MNIDNTTTLEDRVRDYLKKSDGWVSLHQLRGMVGGGDSTTHAKYGVSLSAVVASLKAAKLIETRGGWEGGQFQVRAKA